MSPDLRSVPVDAGAEPPSLASPALLDELFGASPDGVTVQTPRAVVYVNDAALRAMGFADRASLFAASGPTLESAFEVADASGAPVPFADLPGRHVLADGKPRERLLRFRVRATGEERWVLVRASPLFDGSGRVAGALNLLLDATERRHEEETLALQHAVTSLLAASGSPEDALPRVLAALGERLGFDFGALWVADEGALRCDGTWRAPEASVASFESATRGTRLAPGEGLPGRVLQARAPEWIADFATDTRHPRQREARKAGLHGAVAFPLRTGGRVAGVLELFGRDVRAPDARTLATLEAVGGQLGIFLERAQAEATVRENNLRRGAILDASLDCIVTMDETGCVLEWNAAAERTFGWTRAESQGREMAELIVPPELREAHRRGLARYLAAGSGKIVGQRVELPAMRKDGSRFPVELAIVRLPGRRPHFTGFLRDLSDQKRAEEERRASEARLASFYESCPVPLFATAPDGRLIEANPAFARLLGYADVEEFRSIPVSRHYADVAKRAQVRELLERDGMVRSFETEFLRKDGSKVGVSITARAIRDAAGRAVLYEGALEDVSELRLQKALLEAQMESVLDALLVVSMDGRVLSWNRRFAQLWGIPDEVVASRDVEACRRVALDRVKDRERFLEGTRYYGERAREEIRDEVELVDGRILDRFGAPVRMPDGRLVGRIWSYRDVTEARRADARRQELLDEISAQRARLDAIVRSVPGVVYEAWGRPDAPEQRAGFVSDHVEPMLGYTKEQWLGTPSFWLSIVHPEDRERAGREAAEHFATGEGGTLQFRWIRADGTILWAQAWHNPILDETGRSVGMRGVTLDISSRKIAEEALRESEARHRLLAENAQDLISRHAPDGTYRYVSPACRALLGYEPDEMIGRKGAEFVDPEDLARLATEAKPLEGKPDTYLLTLRYRRKDGSRVWLETLATILRDEAGQVREIVASARDISERREAEERLVRLAARLERSNKELDQFAYVTSHDLKAPLRGIANLSRWIEEDLDGNVPPEVRQHLDLLRGRVVRMESLIDAILEYSRVGRVRAKAEPVDTGALVRDVADLLSPPPGFRVEVDPAMPVVEAERLRLHQVFSNLLGNAIKHHHRKDSGVVRVSASDEGGFWRFRVQDDGPGIAPRFHEKVFVIFQTLEARDKVEGTGIGLALVKKIVESQGGTITLDSDEGRGATFSFTWPKKGRPT